MRAQCLFILLAMLWSSDARISAAAYHTQARLVLAAAKARPGDTVLAGVQLRMEPRWHTYWRNPGASGAATMIDWQLPAGVTAGEIQWPVPEKLPDSGRFGDSSEMFTFQRRQGAFQIGGGVTLRDSRADGIPENLAAYL